MTEGDEKDPMALVRCHVYHLPRDFRCPGQVILCGSEERVERMGGEFLQDPARVPGSRFKILSGSCGGVPAALVLTGIGGSAAVLALQELFAAGGRNFLRVGTGGSLSENLLPGDVVIVTGAAHDGLPLSGGMPPGYPAVPTPGALRELMARVPPPALRARWGSGAGGGHAGTGAGAPARGASPPTAGRAPRFMAGLAHTKGDFFQEVPDLNPDPGTVRRRWDEYAGLGVLISSMECAPLFIKARYLAMLTGVRIEMGALLVCAGRCGGDELYAGGGEAKEAVGRGEAAAVRSALEALTALSKRG